MVTQNDLFVWLDEDEYDHAVGSARMKVSQLLQYFNCYGLGDQITPITQAIIDVMEDFGMRVRGLDKEIGRGIRALSRATE